MKLFLLALLAYAVACAVLSVLLGTVVAPVLLIPLLILYGVSKLAGALYRKNSAMQASYKEKARGI